MDKTREVEIRTDLGKSPKARPPLVQFNKFLGWIVASCRELRFRKGGNNKNNTHTHTHTHTHTYIYIYIYYLVDSTLPTYGFNKLLINSRFTTKEYRMCFL